HAHQLIGMDLAAAKAAVANTVDYARSTMGEEAWQQSMYPELPTAERVPNPYTYTTYDGGEARHTARAADAEPTASPQV
ncbi:MAG TPA: hypothetical protein VE132_08505, partial [Micromonosporaceae bacterium]|nr:hypothetical protein [Micromonosporaceae bacterium]